MYIVIFPNSIVCFFFLYDWEMRGHLYFEVFNSTKYQIETGIPGLF